jgi:hypothetical protein
MFFDSDMLTARFIRFRSWYRFDGKKSPRKIARTDTTPTIVGRVSGAATRVGDLSGGHGG